MLTISEIKPSQMVPYRSIWIMLSRHVYPNTTTAFQCTTEYNPLDAEHSSRTDATFFDAAGVLSIGGQFFCMLPKVRRR